MNQEGIFKDDEFLYAQKKSKVDISTLPNCLSDQSVLWTSCQGTYTFASGGIYVGEYKDNMMHGQGTFTYADGRKEVGGKVLWRTNVQSQVVGNQKIDEAKRFSCCVCGFT